MPALIIGAHILIKSSRGVGHRGSERIVAVAAVQHGLLSRGETARTTQLICMIVVTTTENISICEWFAICTGSCFTGAPLPALRAPAGAL